MTKINYAKPEFELFKTKSALYAKIKAIDNGRAGLEILAMLACFGLPCDSQLL